uniref:AB hydrolase-1 domain-containing protein n=1 Tax=Auxenochlorella protothecoides TaxID=3075 RepID=A0A1D2A7I5_AUXPR
MSSLSIAPCPVKARLLREVARGRTRPESPKTRPQRRKGGLPSELAGLHVEELAVCSEEAGPAGLHPQAWVPLRLIRSAAAASPLPTVVLLHYTSGNMTGMAPQAAVLARRGYLVVCIDLRYHGRRNFSRLDDFAAYQAALVAAWHGSGERPFLLDNVWDLMVVADYLVQSRTDVDPSRIAAIGVSLGGMHAWLWAAADARVAAAVPLIAIQSFRYAIEENCYHGRVSSIPQVFQVAAKDLGKEAVDAEVVAVVWERLTPGLVDAYDAPASLPIIAPRPLLVVCGQADPRCVIDGVYSSMQAAVEAYAAAGAEDAVDLIVEEGVGHVCTPTMWTAAFDWLDEKLQKA